MPSFVILFILLFLSIGCHEKGLEEIASEFNLTRERVRQIREKSIIKLRDSGKIKILMKYLG